MSQPHQLNMFSQWQKADRLNLLCVKEWEYLVQITRLNSLQTDKLTNLGRDFLLSTQECSVKADYCQQKNFKFMWMWFSNHQLFSLQAFSEFLLDWMPRCWLLLLSSDWCQHTDFYSPFRDFLTRDFTYVKYPGHGELDLLNYWHFLQLSPWPK